MHADHVREHMSWTTLYILALQAICIYYQDLSTALVAVLLFKHWKMLHVFF